MHNEGVEILGCVPAQNESIFMIRKFRRNVDCEELRCSVDIDVPFKTFADKACFCHFDGDQLA